MTLLCTPQNVCVDSHVVQGGPFPNHLNPGVDLEQPFADADLESVSFQEYHPDFPHEKYTLGYGTCPCLSFSSV